MRKHLRLLIVGASALIALGTVSACSDADTTEATAPETTAPFPQSAKYIADMEQDGKTMVIGIAVDGTEIAAYACNGTDDEAWFFGAQSDGAIDITSKFRDTLNASFNGTDVVGDLTMDGVTYTFTAAQVPAPAGMYTADFEGARASWVVRPDGSATGVQFNGTTGRKFEQAELQQLQQAQFRAEVRNKRLLQQAAQIERLQNGSMRSTINGQVVTPVIVNGNFRL